MKPGDILYYTDKGAKFYFDVELVEIIRNEEYNTDLYKCKILYNKYKFNNPDYKPNFDLKGKVEVFSILSFSKTLEEAEQKIA